MLDVPSPHDKDPDTQTDDLLLDAYSRAVTSVVERVGPSVVRVENITRGGRKLGVGSGVIIASDGLVLTNSHVVSGAKRMRLSFADGAEAEALVLGDDPDTDLALLRTELPSGARAAKLGDSKLLRRGQVVIAIGNPRGFESTVTTGSYRHLDGLCGPAMEDSLRMSSRRMQLLILAAQAGLSWRRTATWWASTPP